ncbi:MAG: NVEALA domain-containing protein [Tannerella sp.]|jgi:hypothetical protein|nr:NVEALA domain-containing protein [Tannerella sp.]
MKKKLLSGIFVLAIASVAVWNVNLNTQSDGLLDISLANVEALAGEGNADCKLSLLYICTSGNSDHYLYRSTQ